MADAPCQNPSCHSYGKPHPNCRCYGGFAEGGETHFCSANRPHDKNCEYYAYGGGVDNKPPPFDEMVDESSPATKDQPPPFDDIVDESPQHDENNPPPFDEMPDESISDANADLDPADLQAKMVAKAHPEGQGGLESPGQQLATVAEGLGQGVAGPLAIMAEEKLGIPSGEIAARQEANPGEAALGKAAGLAGSLVSGVGVGGVAESAAAKLAPTGAAFLKGAITSGLIQGSDEISKSMLGQAPPEPAAGSALAVGFNALMGGFLGYAGSAAQKAVQSAADVNLAGEAYEYLAGYAKSASGEALGKEASDAMRAGHAAYEQHVQKLSNAATGSIAGGMAARVGGYTAAKAADAITSKYFGPYAQKAIKSAGKYAVPAVIRWLSEGANGSAMDVLNYAKSVGSGESMVTKGVDALFRAGTTAAADQIDENTIQRLKNYVDRGGTEQEIKEQLQTEPQTQGFAQGGEIKPIFEQPNTVASVFPAENMILQAAKGRVSGYLSSLRPTNNQPKLAFDQAPDDREAHKTYDRAVRIAAQPMSVFNEIKKGTLITEHLKHMNQMYPELSEHLKKKVTDRIVQSQLEGSMPDFKTRQSLSLFMGTPLSGEFTHQSIQAVQGVFAQAQAQKQDSQPVTKKKKSTAPLTKSDQSFLTDDQARTSRQQRDH